jgi:hypothetical protein
VLRRMVFLPEGGSGRADTHVMRGLDQGRENPKAT